MNEGGGYPQRGYPKSTTESLFWLCLAVSAFTVILADRNLNQYRKSGSIYAPKIHVYATLNTVIGNHSKSAFPGLLSVFKKTDTLPFVYGKTM